ncbi:hypothetical protein [Ensifer sp.]|uniref:hypothetical protein n=1 Tax=Ensifer sp. TaxID=1872086 RepID=UPI00289FC99C|nr:hypothetical protein [Ensifer sp.]
MATYLDNRQKRANKPQEPIPAVRARQGLLGRPVLAVLVGGLILALIAWGIAGLYGEGIDEDAPTPLPQMATERPEITPTNQGIIDNSSTGAERMEPSPVDRDPTPQSGTGGPSEIKSSTGTEKTN